MTQTHRTVTSGLTLGESSHKGLKPSADVGDHRKIQGMPLSLLNILLPAAVVIGRIDGLGRSVLHLAYPTRGLSGATSPSSVVQTGVKSFGWLKRIPHELPSQSWNRIVPRARLFGIRGNLSQLQTTSWFSLPELEPCRSERCARLRNIC